MKNITFLLCCLALFLTTGCWYTVDDDVTAPRESIYEPVVLQRPAFEVSLKVLPDRAVKKAGKIYIKDNLMFINDKNLGFHVYDYSDAQNPVPVCFIKATGATDLAVRNNTIYINQAVDLVTLQYNAATNTVAITKRNRNVFPQKVAPDNGYVSVGENEIITDWQPK